MPTHGSRGHLAGDASVSPLSTKCLLWQGWKWGCRAPIPQCEIHLGCVWVKSAQKAKGWHGAPFTGRLSGISRQFHGNGSSARA